MHFFSRYSYIWTFAPDIEEQYLAFTYRANLIALRMVNVLIMVGMAAFMVIDLFRNVNYQAVLFNRSVAFLMAALLLTVSIRRLLSALWVERFILLSIANVMMFVFVTAWSGNMPPFFLTNLFIAAMVFVTTITGLRFRTAFWLNVILFVALIFFTQTIVTHPFYVSQYPNLATIFFNSTIAGIVLESRRRKSFLQYRDLNEKKRQVDELNEQKSKIISILSHDVAAPLRSLSGLLSMEVRGYLKPEEMSEHLKLTNNQLQGVLTLLNSLVQWSKSQLEGFAIELQEVNVTEIAKTSIALFKLQADSKSLTITLHGAQHLSAMGDADMISLALRNLISNAVKFARQGSEVRIDIEESLKGVGIRISNTGDPIPREVREKLFTYQSASTKGTAGERGTGLGLAMTAYFVKLMNGEITVDETDEGIITFSILLPRAPKV